MSDALVADGAALSQGWQPFAGGGARRRRWKGKRVANHRASRRDDGGLLAFLRDATGRATFFPVVSLRSTTG